MLCCCLIDASLAWASPLRKQQIRPPSRLCDCFRHGVPRSAMNHLQRPDDPAETTPVSGLQLAALLAARMCHDFISPAGAIVSGMDLLDDPTAQDMRDEALNLIGASAKKLVALL